MEDFNDERLLTGTRSYEDSDVENVLRPTTMKEYVGQTKIKANLSILIDAAKNRNEAIEHILLYGPPGLGKTTLSHIIANEMGSNLRVTSGPAIEKVADLASILTNLNEKDVLFIDEIHRLPRAVEEVLYPAMEDYALDFIIGKGPSARTMRLKLQPFTLIGSTTKAGNLSAPLRDRFGMLLRLEMYTNEELAKIISRSAIILGVTLDEDACMELSKRSRGTPRIANRLLKRVRDYAEVRNNGYISLDICKEALELLEIDDLGLDNNDRNIVLTIIEKFHGGPVGLDTLSAATGEDVGTIEDVYEAYLIQLGFIARTPRGRVALPNAFKYFNIPLSENRQKYLNMFINEQQNSDSEAQQNKNEEHKKQVLQKAEKLLADLEKATKVLENKEEKSEQKNDANATQKNETQTENSENKNDAADVNIFSSMKKNK